MNRTLLGGAVAAVLTLSGVAAHAGCADPRAVGRLAQLQRLPAPMLEKSIDDTFFKWGRGEDSGRGIVGTWHVTYTAGGAPFGEAFIQWHADGTEWENINFPVLGGNICMGSWKQVGKRQFSRSHIGWSYDNGALSGYFTETETNELAFDGNSYSGTNDSKIYDLKNNLLAEVQGRPRQSASGPEVCFSGGTPVARLKGAAGAHPNRGSLRSLRRPPRWEFR
jgi:hypothetical protein